MSTLLTHLHLSLEPFPPVSNGIPSDIIQVLSMHPRGSMPNSERSLSGQHMLSDSPYSPAVRTAMRMNASCSDLDTARNAPDPETLSSFPYTSTKLKTHLSVHSAADLQRRSNLREWYPMSLVPAKITGSYLHTILSRPMRPAISMQASFTSAFGGTPGSRSLP